MGQMGFFDLGNRRYSGLDAKNEPLLKIDGVVPWEDLRARLEAVWRRADKARKSRAGRKPWDAIDDVQDDHSVRALQSLGTTKVSIRSVTACRSCDFWGWV